ncbi:MAG TPA: hypothetical protein VHE99_02315 [Gammaproteobacteria bacterium]|nr:hypothetical protein [Gammaproteobacteria bacterium]
MKENDINKDANSRDKDPEDFTTPRKEKKQEESTLPAAPRKTKKSQEESTPAGDEKTTKRSSLLSYVMAPIQNLTRRFKKIPVAPQRPSLPEEDPIINQAESIGYGTSEGNLGADYTPRKNTKKKPKKEKEEKKSNSVAEEFNALLQEIYYSEDDSNSLTTGLLEHEIGIFAEDKSKPKTTSSSTTEPRFKWPPVSKTEENCAKTTSAFLSYLLAAAGSLGVGYAAVLASPQRFFVPQLQLLASPLRQHAFSAGCAFLHSLIFSLDEPTPPIVRLFLEFAEVRPILNDPDLPIHVIPHETCHPQVKQEFEQRQKYLREFAQLMFDVINPNSEVGASFDWERLADAEGITTGDNVRDDIGATLHEIIGGQPITQQKVTHISLIIEAMVLGVDYLNLPATSPSGLSQCPLLRNAVYFVWSGVGMMFEAGFAANLLGLDTAILDTAKDDTDRQQSLNKLIAALIWLIPPIISMASLWLQRRARTADHIRSYQHMAKLTDHDMDKIHAPGTMQPIYDHELQLTRLNSRFQPPERQIMYGHRYAVAADHKSGTTEWLKDKLRRIFAVPLGALGFLPDDLQVRWVVDAAVALSGGALIIWNPQYVDRVQVALTELGYFAPKIIIEAVDILRRRCYVGKPGLRSSVEYKRLGINEFMQQPGQLPVPASLRLPAQNSSLIPMEPPPRSRYQGGIENLQGTRGWNIAKNQEYDPEDIPLVQLASDLSYSESLSFPSKSSEDDVPTKESKRGLEDAESSEEPKKRKKQIKIPEDYSFDTGGELARAFWPSGDEKKKKQVSFRFPDDEGSSSKALDNSSSSSTAALVTSLSSSVVPSSSRSLTSSMARSSVLKKTGNEKGLVFPPQASALVSSTAQSKTSNSSSDNKFFVGASPSPALRDPKAISPAQASRSTSVISSSSASTSMSKNSKSDKENDGRSAYTGMSLSSSSSRES